MPKRGSKQIVKEAAVTEASHRCQSSKTDSGNDGTPARKYRRVAMGRSAKTHPQAENSHGVPLEVPRPAPMTTVPVTTAARPPSALTSSTAPVTRPLDVSTQPPTESPLSAPQLHYHLIHLINAYTNALGSYISLEAVLRDIWVTQNLHYDYPQQLHFLSDLLRSLRDHIRGVADTLARKPEHVEFRRKAGYRTLHETSHSIVQECVWVPQGGDLPDQQRLVQLRMLYAKCVDMRSGTREIEGYWQCWDEVEYPR